MGQWHSVNLRAPATFPVWIANNPKLCHPNGAASIRALESSVCPSAMNSRLSLIKCESPEGGVRSMLQHPCLGSWDMKEGSSLSAQVPSHSHCCVNASCGSKAISDERGYMLV
ncbi:uncharacterized protein BDV17DRAFT_253382 [Aspergillus undulatus]|uniref:uncharacterized protein n=1 Tax=Aspergillus undulatus TaxID=1810928 RepID=UPI003CCCE09C